MWLPRRRRAVSTTTRKPARQKLVRCHVIALHCTVLCCIALCTYWMLVTWSDDINSEEMWRDDGIQYDRIGQGRMRWCEVARCVSFTLQHRVSQLVQCSAVHSRAECSASSLIVEHLLRSTPRFMLLLLYSLWRYDAATARLHNMHVSAYQLANHEGNVPYSLLRLFVSVHPFFHSFSLIWLFVTPPPNRLTQKDR